MPSRVCDGSPCSHMRLALPYLLMPKPDDETLDILVIAKNAKAQKVLWRVTLQYCPFCGTRIDPDFVQSLVKGPRSVLR